jgi:PqqD family protein of HPr-rel-A system
MTDHLDHPVSGDRAIRGDRPVGGDRPVRSGTIEINPVDDGYVVYDPDSDRVHYLNHTAAVVLELCTGANSLADIAAGVRAAYGLTGSLETQVSECVGKLRAERIVGPPAPAAADDRRGARQAGTTADAGAATPWLPQ